MSVRSNRQGFTIVELLIVIVVIAILASISIVTYTGIQQRARDTQRKFDVSSLVKALEFYKIDNGSYPPGQIGWCTQISNTNHTDVITALSPYMGAIPKDPAYANTYRDYFYRNHGTSYDLYAQMEGSANANGSYSTGGCNTIGGTPHTYNYARIP